MSQVVTNGNERAALQGVMVAHGDAAVNTTLTVTTATPDPNQFVYITGLDYDVSADGTGTAAANLKFTSTNLWSWASVYSQAVGADVNLHQPFTFPVPIRAQNAGQPVAIVSPAAQLHSTFSINIYYYLAP